MRSILLLSILLLSGCQSVEESQDENISIAPKVVKVLTLDHNTAFKKSYEYPAEIYAQKHAEMAFEASGKIIKSPRKVGERVKRGAVLAKLDDSIFQSNVRMAKANYNKAKSDYTRYKKLYISNNISLSQFEQVKQAQNVSKAQYNIALKTLSKTKLVADFDGVIAKKLVNDFARVMAKQPILILEDTKKLKVKFFIPENDITQSSQKINMKNVRDKVDFYVSISNREETRYKAKLLDVATNAQKVTRTYEATLLIDNPKDTNILPGMTAKVEVILKHGEERKLFIPLQAVFSDASKASYVWKVNEVNEVSKQKVSTGKLQNKTIEVLEGLMTSDSIVTSGVHFLKENDTIQVYKKLGN
ncbi:MAG: Unknown protein [uncultured Sulfurovum sp.]|uniref:Multidrug resistance protein MdtA-like C-terminal permuted SH3 domain-containing protein n=1 Tax=uncultured Sulfurovum sp. TaxID=269237 RepID=A0A6S6U1G9_9BACT|nr:MAG: Unknown protein [uncultured Sulfurovum sp.]